jgi:hypothetical protein
LPANAGGYIFLVNPNLSAVETPIFWLPQADPGTVVLTSTPPVFGSELGPTGLKPTAVLPGPDGLSILHSTGGERIPVLLHGDAGLNRPLAAIIPLDADGLERIEAVARLWRSLHKPPGPPDLRLTWQQRRRLRQMLLAIDGRIDGASYREIAEAIYGARRVSDDPWKTSALRDSTMALVKSGFALIAGGYRKLLRHRRRR